MNCEYCGVETNMTARDSYRELHVCCRECRQRKGLTISSVYKTKIQEVDTWEGMDA